ncbi:hypothetical protein MCEMSE15_00840 [Fimbriimonadaceae bacterium]
MLKSMYLKLFFRWLAVILVAEGLALSFAAFGNTYLTFFALLWLQLFAGMFLLAAVQFCKPAAKSYLYWLAPLVLIAWLATSFTSVRYSTYDAVRFIVQKPRLLQAVSDAKKAKGKSGQVGGCKFENTDALRVYCQDGGMMDHQYGYFYDPTGRVLSINDSSELTSANPLSDWFTGNLNSARSIGGDWYIVYFG